MHPTKVRKTVLKPTLTVCNVTIEKKTEVVYCLYPQDFHLLINLFGEMVLCGIRKRRPRVGQPDIRVADGFVMNPYCLQLHNGGGYKA